MNEINLGARLSELIIENRIDVKTLCEALKLSKMTVYRYLSNQRKPNYDILVAIADYFKCSIDFLVGISEENYPTNSSDIKFHERFINLLKQDGITEYKLIKDTHISRSLFYSWVKGKSRPNVFNLVKLAQYLDCSIDYLVGREDCN
jgi:transcriptional regulator with XRE-family HTH domain